MRDLTRAREDAKEAQTRARHQLKAFLLRSGIRYAGKTAWTPAHVRWIAGIKLEQPVQQIVFQEYVDQHGLEEIADVFAKGVKIEVGDMLPSAHYETILKRVPKVWEKAFEVNAAADAAVRASCVEFVLAGLWAGDKVSRAERHGRVMYDVK